MFPAYSTCRTRVFMKDGFGQAHVRRQTTIVVARAQILYKMTPEHWQYGALHRGETDTVKQT